MGAIVSIIVMGAGVVGPAAGPAAAQTTPEATAPAASGAAAPASAVSFTPVEVVAEPAATAPASAPASASASAPAPAPASTSPAPAPPPPSRQVDAPWFDQPLGADPAAWRYSAALELLGATDQAEALRRVLLRRHLLQLAGTPAAPAAPTVRQALAEGAALPPSAADGALRSRWAELVNQHLRAVPPPAALPVPPELEADQARLREAAPGLWTLLAPDGSLRGRVWWLLLHNRAPQALALADFRVRTAAGTGLGMMFDCSLPRYAEMALAAPGQDRAYLCRSGAGGGNAAAWDDLARLLRRATGVPLQIEPAELADARAAQGMALRLEAPQHDAALTLAAAAEAAQAAARAASTAAATAASAAAAAHAAAGLPRATLGPLRLAGVALLALALYALLHALAGRRAALLLGTAALMVVSLLAVFKGLPGLWPAPAGLPPLPRVLAALVLPLFAAALLAAVFELLRAFGRGVLAPMFRGFSERLSGRY
ncbi:MAG: hypothetical protein LCI02_29265 [Proteobacteria bacterium]|nr:hypothetical protein [Pseudomonadota bacterium]